VLTFLDEWLFRSIGEYELKGKMCLGEKNTTMRWRWAFIRENGGKKKMRPMEKMLLQVENGLGEKTIIQGENGSLIKWFFRQKTGLFRGKDMF
jgi:hypothetical protein